MKQKAGLFIIPATAHKSQPDRFTRMDCPYGIIGKTTGPGRFKFMYWNQLDTYVLAGLIGVFFGAISLAGLGTVFSNRILQRGGQALFVGALPAVLGLWLILRGLGVAGAE